MRWTQVSSQSFKITNGSRCSLFKFTIATDISSKNLAFFIQTISEVSTTWDLQYFRFGVLHLQSLNRFEQTRNFPRFVVSSDGKSLHNSIHSTFIDKVFVTRFLSELESLLREVKDTQKTLLLDCKKSDFSYCITKRHLKPLSGHTFVSSQAIFIA